MEVPALLFDKLWRSKKSTEKYITKVLQEKINFYGKRVLDFGCGTGSYCFLFDSDKYLGVDTSEKRINFAKKNYPRYNFQKISSDKLQLEKNKFDYIFIVSTLHHLTDAKNKEFIKQFFEILDNDGIIVGMEPCLFPDTIFNNWFMKFIDRGKFIRDEQGYKSLLEGYFLFETQKKYIRQFVYNELFYIARKKSF